MQQLEMQESIKLKEMEEERKRQEIEHRRELIKHKIE